MNTKQGTVYFFTGLSGAGKTTLGTLFAEHLRAKKGSVFLMDGDEMRQTYFGQAGYTTKDRHDSCFPWFKLCRLMAKQEIDVVTCSISMYKDVRQWNRENIPNYIEIYVRTEMKTLFERDKKGIYSKGVNVVGLDLPCDYPAHPNIIIQNDGKYSPAELVQALEKALAENRTDGYVIGG